VDADLDTFVTALYVTIDDTLRNARTAPMAPESGLVPKLSDAELLTLAVLQALLGFISETRFLRHAEVHLRAWFPYIPHRSGYNKRLRKAEGQLRAVIRLLASDTELWDDDTWVMDSTPVECGRSRPTVKRPDLAGWASYGYCASHSRWFWGLRLHLVRTPAGLPVAFALANPRIDEREVARDLFEAEPTLVRAGQRILADKGYRSRESEQFLGEHGVELIRPAHKGDRNRASTPLLKPLRPADRIGQRHTQDPARPRATRGQNPRWRPHSRAPAPARAHSGHLAQLQDGSTTAALPRRVRSRLTPWN